MTSAPSRERRRLTAPMRTPRAVESRNVVSVRSTTMRLLPDSIASVSFSLSSGAVNRSISPRTATTWRSVSRASSVRANSGGIGGGLWQAGRWETLPGERELDREHLAAVVSGDDVDLVGDALQDVAHAGQRRVREQPAGAALLELADVQLDGVAPRHEPHGHVPVGGVGLRMRGDRVGHEQRVVEAVDGALGARGEHAHDATEDGCHERAVDHADDRLVAARMVALRAHAPSASRKVMRTSVRSRSSLPSSSDSVSVAMSGSPRPSPGESGRGTMPRPSSRTTTVRWSLSTSAATIIGPSPPS